MAGSLRHWWLVGWLISVGGWLVGWLVGWLADLGILGGWLVGWLAVIGILRPRASWAVGWLIGWLAVVGGWLVGWLAYLGILGGWLVGWLAVIGILMPLGTSSSSSSSSSPFLPPYRLEGWRAAVTRPPAPTGALHLVGSAQGSQAPDPRWIAGIGSRATLEFPGRRRTWEGVPHWERPTPGRHGRQAAWSCPCPRWCRRWGGTGRRGLRPLAAPWCRNAG